MALRKLVPQNTDPSVHRSLDLDEGALEVVKDSPGFVVGGWVTNLHVTDPRYVKIYNAVSGTAGTGTPVFTIPVLAGQSLALTEMLDPGKHFDTGICVGATTGIADADTGAPGANEVVLHLFYY